MARKAPLFPPEMINGVTMFDAERRLQMLDLCDRYHSPSKNPLDNDADPDEHHEQDGSVNYLPPKLLPTYDQEYITKMYGKDTPFICAYLNTLLSHSYLAKPYLPLAEANLLERLSDGILLCAVANTLKPGSIEENAVKHRDPLQNFNIAMMSMHMLGIYFNEIERLWIGSERCALFPPGILLQVVRLVSLAKIGLKDNEKLAYVFDNWEDEQAIANIRAVPHEEVLRRWVNYQLKKAGTEVRMTNFTSSLCDSVIYAYLLQTVAPKEKKEWVTTVQTVSAEKDRLKRAQMIVNNAEVLGMIGLISPEHIAGSTKSVNPSLSLSNQIIYTMNVAFLAQIFYRFPAIDQPANKMNPALTDALRQKVYNRGSLEETMVMWLNSFGPNSPVTYLDTDLRNGLVLLQVWESMFPRSVDWSFVTIRVDDSKPPHLNVCCLANCTEAAKQAVKHGIKCKCSSSDIASGEMKTLMPMLLEMMFLHAQMKRARMLELKPSAKLSRSELTDWFNEQMKQYGSSFQIKDIGDSSMKDTTAVAFLAERILVGTGRVFTPEHQQQHVDVEQQSSKKSGKFKATLTAVRALMFRNPKKQQQQQQQQQQQHQQQQQQQHQQQQQQQRPSGNSFAPGSPKWQFETVRSLTPKEQELYSLNATTLMRQGGVTVFTAKLGPENDEFVYLSILLQLNAIAN